MTALLATKRIPFRSHHFHDIAIAYRRLNRLNSTRMQSLMQAQIAHHRRHKRVALEQTAAMQIDRQHDHRIVAIDDAPCFVD